MSAVTFPIYLSVRGMVRVNDFAVFLYFFICLLAELCIYYCLDFHNKKKNMGLVPTKVIVNSVTDLDHKGFHCTLLCPGIHWVELTASVIMFVLLECSC